MDTAEEVATSHIRSKLREVRRFCDEVGGAVPTTIVNVIKLAREDVETKRKKRRFLAGKLI